MMLKLKTANNRMSDLMLLLASCGLFIYLFMYWVVVAQWWSC